MTKLGISLEALGILAMFAFIGMDLATSNDIWLIGIGTGILLAITGLLLLWIPVARTKNRPKNCEGPK